MKKLPIDPLSDAAWRRIEERVESALARPMPMNNEPRSPRWVFGLAAAAIVIAIAALVIAVWPRDAEPIATTSTRVETRTGESGGELGDVRIEVAPETAYTAVGSDSTGWVVVLERGEITCDVPPREGRPPFVVRAGDAHVEVVGTRFIVSYDGVASRVSVERGTVRVRHGDRSSLVGAGERWPAPVVVIPAPPVEPEVEERSPSRRFAEASRLETAAPARADRIYAELSEGTGPWAANALFARARLAADRGHDRRARTLAQSYLRRFPRGPNATDARRLLEVSR
jgi:hypothetical protein